MGYKSRENVRLLTKLVHARIHDHSAKHFASLGVLGSNLCRVAACPVLQFFYYEVGANADQIGNIGVLSSIFALILAPLYGKLVDAKCTYSAMLLSWFLCTLGCLVRGIARSINYLYLGGILMGLAGSVDALVLAHLSLHIDRTRRSTVVSSFGAISTSVRLSGSFLYPPMNKILQTIIGTDDYANNSTQNDVSDFSGSLPPVGNEKKLLRYRVTVAFCTVGCLIGFLCLIRMIIHIYMSNDHKQIGIVDCKDSEKLNNILEETERDPMETMNKINGQQESQESFDAGCSHMNCQRCGDGNRDGKKWRCLIFSMGAGLICLSIARVVLQVIWPLYLRRLYGWGSMEYGIAVIFSATSSLIHLSLLPSLERRWSLAFVLVNALLVCSALSLVATLSSKVNQYLHTVLICWLSGVLAMTDSCLRSMCTLYGGRVFQGRTWGLLSSLAEMGRMIGSSFARFLKYSLDLPFYLVSLLLFGTFLLFAFLKRLKWIEDPHQLQHVYEPVTTSNTELVGENSGFKLSPNISATTTTTKPLQELEDSTAGNSLKKTVRNA